jgi:uncharacterized protein (DUF1800 family)
MQPKPTSRFRRAAALTAAVTVLTLVTGPLSAQRAIGVADNADIETITHVLNRLGFGPRPGDIERVQATGLQAYIEEQLHPERIDDAAALARLDAFQTIEMSSQDLAEQFFVPANQLRRQQQRQQTQMAQNDMTMADPATERRRQQTPEDRQVRQAAQNVTSELMRAKMLRAAVSERQLEEVLVDFWFNHFNVFIAKGQVRQYVTEYEREAIRPYVLGNFRDMLGATATSPAMLFYLDNYQSQAENLPVVVNPNLERRLRDPRLSELERQRMLRQVQNRQRRQQRGLNENYARELMELHTLGVDGGYTQDDVINVARILTGWTIDRPQQGGDFVFRAEVHDMNPKTVLGTEFGANGGREEGEVLLDMLAAHPATAHHIAYKLTQRFVADEPPAALVERAARTFLDTDGDLGEVTRLIVTSPEFFSAEARRAKVKTPFEFIVSAVRATGARVTNAQPLVAAMNNLGMPLYGAQPPTGYSMTADAWVNTGALLGRMNLAVQLISGTAPLQPERTLRGEQPPTAGRGRGRGQLSRRAIRVDLASLVPDTSDATRNRLIQTMLAGEVSDATRETLALAESPQQLLALTLGSPEFQRR